MKMIEIVSFQINTQYFIFKLKIHQPKSLWRNATPNLNTGSVGKSIH